MNRKIFPGDIFTDKSGFACDPGKLYGFTNGGTTVPEPAGAASLLEQIEAIKVRIVAYKPPDVAILTPSWEALEAEFAKQGVEVTVGAGDRLAASISGIKVVVIPEMSRPTIVPAEVLRSPGWSDMLKGML